MLEILPDVYNQWFTNELIQIHYGPFGLRILCAERYMLLLNQGNWKHLASYLLMLKKPLIGWNGYIYIYLWYTLKKFNFGDQFIRMIQPLYTNPMARVSTGGLISDIFNICRGTRQGCPLSPLMFNLSIEPLAQFISQCKHIILIQLCSSVHSISLYADDTLLFLSDLQRSLPKALKVLDELGKLSGFKINHSKSILMPLNSGGSNFPNNNIQISTQVKYLGIELRPTLSLISKVNYM